MKCLRSSTADTELENFAQKQNSTSAPCPHRSPPYLVAEDLQPTICAVLCLVTQLCLTLCDPMDCSPPDSCVHGDSPGKSTGDALLQGIFTTQGSNPGLQHCRQILYHLSHQEYWNGQSIPSPGDLPNLGIELESLALQADSLPAELPGKPSLLSTHHWFILTQPDN